MDDENDALESTVRWPRDRWISPTALNTYSQCPKRIRLTHIDEIKPPWRYQVNLAKGRIAHDLLRDIARLIKGDHVIPDQAELLNRARLRLPPDMFPSPAAREADTAEIVRWVVYGTAYLKQIPDAKYLLIEKNQPREHVVFPGHRPHTLMARPDVVVQRWDDDGLPLVEIIDYKTGAIRPEPDPPVIMRFVARELLQRLYGDPSSVQMRFTWLWLAHRERTQIDLSVEHCYEAWPLITQQVHALTSETEWRATPSVLCHWCPYHGNVCTEEIPASDS